MIIGYTSGHAWSTSVYVTQDSVSRQDFPTCQVVVDPYPGQEERNASMILEEGAGPSAHRIDELMPSNWCGVHKSTAVYNDGPKDAASFILLLRLQAFGFGTIVMLPSGNGCHLFLATRIPLTVNFKNVPLSVSERIHGALSNVLCSI